MPTPLQDLLARLPPDTRPLDFQQLIEAVYQVRWTGPITIDFHNGTPKQISLGQPVKLAICAGGVNGTLDKG